MPAMIASFPCVTDRGAPGGAEPPASPEVMIVPIGVPSLFKISNLKLFGPPRAISATACPGVGVGLRTSSIESFTQVPLAG